MHSTRVTLLASRGEALEPKLPDGFEHGEA